MSIRGWERSTLLVAVSAAAVMGLAACGPTSEPTGGESSPETSASQPEKTTAAPEGTAAEGKPEADGPSPSGPSSSAPPPASQPAAEPGKQSGKTAGPAPDKDDNAPALCDAADLNGSIKEIRGGATAGSVHRGIVLTNSSDEPCILKGFPGVSYVDASGSQIGAPADRNTSTASPAIELQSGESAMATVKQTHAENYGSQCHQRQAAGLRVYPPSAYDSLIIEQHITACAANDIVLMTIGAFQPIK